MSMGTHLLCRARKLLAAGKVTDAQAVIAAVLQQEADNADAWYLWQQTVGDEAEQRRILARVLRLEPDHAEAQQALRALDMAAARGSAPMSLTEKTTAVDPIEQYQLAVLMLVAALITTIIGFSYFMVLDGRDKQSMVGENSVLAQRYETAVAAIQDLTAANTQLQGDQQQLQSQFTQLTGQHAGLRAEHNTLVSTHHELQMIYQTLRDDYAALVTQYDALVEEYEALNGRYATLQQERDSLVSAYNQLGSQHNQLQTNYNQLYEENEWRKTVGAFPPYIRVIGERNAELVFYRSNGQLNRWVISMEALAADIVRGNRDRHSILKALFHRVTLDGLEGRGASAPDFRKFVDPTPFYPYISSIYNQSSSDDAFLRELWYITTQLTTYSTEMNETPRYPLETLLAGGGDCEDTSILLASMIKAAPTSWRTFLVYINGDYPYQRVQPNHIMVYVITPQRHYLIETTSRGEMEPLDINQAEGWWFEVEG